MSKEVRGVSGFRRPDEITFQLNALRKADVGAHFFYRVQRQIGKPTNIYAALRWF